MKIAILMTVALLTQSTAYGDTLQGEWRQTDVRSIEAGWQGDSGVQCLRIWLEQRTYSLQINESRAEGSYTNTLTAIPLGLVGNHPGCEFEAPATEPLIFHTRTWNIVGSRVDADEWKVSGRQGTSVGPLDDVETSPFSTTLRLESGRLVDVREDSDLVFTRPGEQPDARAVLELEIQKLYAGGCVDVYKRLELAAGMASKVDEICDLIDRSKRFTGRFRAIEVERVEPFDAVPRDFPDPSSADWVDRPGVVFDYKITFEHQNLFGTAIVWRKEGRWQLAFVW